MTRAALVIARREVRDATSDWRIGFPILMLSIIFPVLVLVLLKYGGPYVNKDAPVVAIADLTPFTALIVGFFPASFSLAIALESFVGEKERNSLESLLSVPVSDLDLYAGKLLGATLAPICGSMLGLSVYLVGLRLFVGQALAPELLAQVVLLTLLQALVMVAAAVLVSSHTTSVRAATLLASFIVLPMSVVVQVEAISLLYNHGGVLWVFAIEMGLVACILLRAGVHVLNREQLLAREVDTLSPRRIGSRFRALLAARATGERDERFTWRRLYLRHVPAIVRANRIPALLLVGALVAGFWAGAWLAQGTPVPEQVLRRGLAVRGLHGLRMPEPSLWFILRQNLTIAALTPLLASLTFGGALLVLLFAPAAIVGFLWAQAHSLGLPTALVVAAVVPHGWIELPAFVLVGAAAFRVGTSLIAPQPDWGIGESYLLALANWVRVMALAVPLLLLAALVEVYVTPRLVVALFGG